MLKRLLIAAANYFHPNFADESCYTAMIKAMVKENKLTMAEDTVQKATLQYPNQKDYFYNLLKT